jgi:hypothetical protein
MIAAAEFVHARTYGTAARKHEILIVRHLAATNDGTPRSNTGALGGRASRILLGWRQYRRTWVEALGGNTVKSTHGDGQRSGGFIDSHAFFLMILMFMFALAIAISIVGFTSPSWLGFN